MREILFRGKSVNNGEWAEGFLVIDTIFCEDAAPVKHYHIDEMNLGTFPVEFQSGISETVDPETVGQFTGITDKNGKKIFEGDIVQAYFRNNHSIQRFRVVFDDGMFLFDNNCVKVPKYDIYAMTDIGNIHDNPELLEVTDNA